MAAFSTLALIGLGLAGGLAAGKLATRSGGEGDTASGPHANSKPGDTVGSQAPAPPPSLASTNAAAFGAASSAAQRQRKRASAGATLLTPKTNSKVGAVMQPKQLLGY